MRRALQQVLTHGADTRLTGVIDRLGLRRGLKLVIDAGDMASFQGGQILRDLSRSYVPSDFLLGNTSSEAAEDPVFTGQLNRLSAADSFLFNGSQYLKLNGSSPSWADNLHKDNALGTILWWGSIANFSSTYHMVGTSGGAPNVGIKWNTRSGNPGELQMTVYRANVTSCFQHTSGLVATAGRMHLMGWSIVEPQGANGSIMQLDNAFNLASSTYTTPSSGAATGAMELGAVGDGTQRIPNGSRFAACAIWEGRALTQNEMLQFWHATRARFGR